MRFASGSRVRVSACALVFLVASFACAGTRAAAVAATVDGATGSNGTQSPTGLLPPTMTKVFSPNPVPPGDPSTLTFTITNPNTAATLNNIGFTDTFPAGMVIASTSQLFNTCGGANVGVPGSNNLLFGGGTLAPGASCTVNINVTVANEGTYVNTSSNVTSANGGTGNTATDTLRVVVPPAVLKTFSPISVPVNGTASLSLQLINEGSGALNGIAITDNLPSGMVVATPSGLANGCGGSATAADGSTSVAISGVTLAAGASCVVSLSVQVLQAGQLVNTTGAVTSANGGNGFPGQAFLYALEPPSIAKAFTPATVPLNGTSQLTLTLTNPAANPIGASGVNVTDEFPIGLVVATPSNLVSTCRGTATATAGSGSISLSNGVINRNASCTITLDVTPTQTGTLVNTTGNVSSSGGGAGNTATASLNVSALAPPSVAKAFSPTTIAPGGTSTLTITLANANASALNGVSVTDTLPAGMTVAASNALTNACGGTASALSGSVTLSGGTIPANASCTLSVAVTAAKPGNFVNTIDVGAVGTTNAGPNTVATAATLTVQAPLAVEPTPTLDARMIALLALTLLLGGGYAQRRLRRR